uniref:Corticotropin-releasing factor domain-containing protein n=1 Tax=Strongyloides stercoralis TaxID=6248 RepID=A0AAF5CUG1_STRER
FLASKQIRKNMKFFIISILLAFLIVIGNCQISKKIVTDNGSLKDSLKKEPVGPPLFQHKEILDHLMVPDQRGQMPSLRPPPGVAGKLNMVKLRDFMELVRAVKHKQMLAAL